MISPGLLNSYYLSSLWGAFPGLFDTYQSLGASLPPGLPAPPTSLGLTYNQLTYQFQDGLSAALSGLSSHASALYQAARRLDPTVSSSALQARVATSSNATALSATASQGATLASYNVVVTALAQAQQNTGVALAPTAAATVATGTNTFTITAGGVTTQISFNVAAGDTNQTVLNNMAAAINNARIGVSAAVTTDAAGNQRLQITSKLTGTAAAFTIADVAGNAVAATGAATVTTAAANASYTVNGVAGTSQSNTIYLDNGNVKVNLLAVSAAGATITVSPDSQAITGAVNNFVTQYNNMVNFLRINQQYISPVVSQTLAQAAGDVAGLRTVGISVNPDGTLTVNPTQLAAAIQTGYGLVSSALGGFNGIATRSESLANSILTSPSGQFAAAFPAWNLDPNLLRYQQAQLRYGMYSYLFVGGGALNSLF